MKTSKIWLYLILGGLIFAGIFINRMFLTRADGDPIVYLKVEASKDNGTTWYNYSGTDSPESEILAVNPGDSILVRIKIWTTESTAYIVGGAGIVTNSQYLSDIELISLDSDENANEYDGYFFDESGIGTITIIGIKDEATADSATARITIANNIPAGTVIEGGVEITSAVEVAWNPFGKVFAQGLKNSAFRLIYQVLPETGADL